MWQGETPAGNVSAGNTPESRREFAAGIRAELPILLGVVPFGMIYGVVAVGAMPAAPALAMSSIVFAGSAQFIGAQLMTQATPWFVILATTLVVNLRHVLYSASLAPYLEPLGRAWKAVLAYLLTDEAYVVVAARYHARPADGGHWYFLGAGLALWMTWQASTAAGIFLGAQVPAGWSLDFALPLTFIALVAPALRDRAGRAAAVCAGVVAVLAVGLPLRMGLLLAVVLGLAAGALTEALA